MRSAVLFNDLNSIDFYDIRTNVARIPEVIQKIQEAQKIWDSFDEGGFHFLNFLSAPDEIFLENIKFRNLAAAIVQIGLFERHIKKHSTPDFLVGCSNGDSALLVCSGKRSLTDLIVSSHAAKSVEPVVELKPQRDLLLSGIALNEYAIYQYSKIESGQKYEGSQKMDNIHRLESLQRGGVFQNMDTNKTACQYEKLAVNGISIQKIILELIEEYGVESLTNIGPGMSLITALNGELSLRDVRIQESIDIDPMLSWFWHGVTRDIQNVL